MAPVKILGLTLYEEAKTVHWSLEEKTPNEFSPPQPNCSVRVALGYLATLLPSGLVPVAGWQRPIVTELRSLCGRQAGAEGWEVPVYDRIVKGLALIDAKLQTVGNPMRGVWEISGLICNLYVDAANNFLGYVLKSEMDTVIADGCKHGIFKLFKSWIKISSKYWHT